MTTIVTKIQILRVKNYLYKKSNCTYLGLTLMRAHISQQAGKLSVIEPCKLEILLSRSLTDSPLKLCTMSNQIAVRVCQTSFLNTENALFCYLK